MAKRILLGIAMVLIAYLAINLMSEPLVASEQQGMFWHMCMTNKCCGFASCTVPRFEGNEPVGNCNTREVMSYIEIVEATCSSFDWSTNTCHGGFGDGYCCYVA